MPSTQMMQCGNKRTQKLKMHEVHEVCPNELECIMYILSVLIFPASRQEARSTKLVFKSISLVGVF